MTEQFDFVAEVQGRPVTKAQLSLAFDAVAPKPNWKSPIRTEISLDPYTMALVREAIIFFTGSVPTFRLQGGTTTGAMGRYSVTADGYYLTIGS